MGIRAQLILTTPIYQFDILIRCYDYQILNGLMTPRDKHHALLSGMPIDDIELFVYQTMKMICEVK